MKGNYLTDLEGVLAEIAAVPVTVEAVDEEAMDPKLFEEIQEYYPMLPFADLALVRRLEGLIQKFPEEAKVRNHLSAAYHYMGRQKKAVEISRGIFRDFPDYLFARVNEANILLREDRVEEVLELLGPTLRLGDLYPETELFHLSELRSYYHAVAEYHLHEGREELADGIAQFLLELNSEPHQSLESLRQRILLKKMERRTEAMFEERNRMIVVREGREVVNFSKELPRLNHRELEVLYRKGYELAEGELEMLLALPRESLVEDLETILRDCFERTAYFRKLARRSGNEHKFFGVTHALFMLGELEANESLPVVLEVMKATGKALEFWLGEGMYDDFWQPLMVLIGENLELVSEWFLTPGVGWSARNIVSYAIVQGVFRMPERAGLIHAWLGEMLEALLDADLEDNVYDTHVAQELVAMILDFALKENHGLVVRFYERPDYQRSFLGDLEEIESDLLADPPKVKASELKPMTMAERYRSWTKSPEPKVDSSPQLPFGNDSLGLPPMRAKAEAAGRNDPCPCGSGKKYKKCCL